MGCALLANTPSITEPGTVELWLADLLVDFIVHSAHPLREAWPGFRVSGMAFQNFAEGICAGCTGIQIGEIVHEAT